MEPGCYYHVYNRGNNRENLFLSEANYHYFLHLYRKYIFPVAATYAYCLLPNHFHLLIRIRDEQEQQIFYQQTALTPLPYKYVPPYRSFGHLFNAYTKGLNFDTGRRGSLFEKNFKYKEITHEVYFTRLVWYIHRNPQRHGLIRDFTSWPYSSYHSLLSVKPTLLEREQTIGWFHNPVYFRQFHDQPHLLCDVNELLIDE